jgi:ABC-type transporter Mla subunit MlaD
VTELELVSDGKLGVRVELEVDRDASIPAGAHAYFEFAGVSGLKMVNIRGGDAKAPALPAGSELPAGETTLDKLGSQGEELLARAGKALENADRLIAGLERSTSKLDPERVDQTVKDAQRAMNDLGRTAAALNQMVSESRAQVRRSLSSAEQTLAQIDQAVQRSDAAVSNLNTTVAELRGVVQENGGDVRTTLDNLREASRSFKTLSQELRRRPNRLLFGGSVPDRELP